MRTRTRFVPLAVLAASLTAVLLGARAGDLFFSWRARANDALLLSATPPSDIVIVAIDNPSIQTVGAWPWDRAVHAKIIKTLADAGAKAIGYDVSFTEPRTLDGDAALAAAIAAAPVVLPLQATIDTRTVPPTATGTLAPLPAFAAHATLGMANTPPDSDGVLRVIPWRVREPGGNDVPSFFAALATRAGENVPAHGEFLRVRFYGGPRTFTTISAKDVLANQFPEALFSHAIVLVGATAPDLHDLVTAPLALAEPLPGVEVHANAFASARTGGLRMLPIAVEAACILFFILFGLLATTFFRRVRYAMILAGVLLVAFLIAAFVLIDRSIILPIFFPIMSIMISLVGGTLLRLSNEKREKAALRTTLQRYVSKQVVADLLANPQKLKLGGEKREMSVLFSDLRGFTTLSEKMSAEQLVNVLNTYLGAMTAIVFAHDGVLDKYMGDAVMAFWNAPLDDARHAEHAVDAALAMRATIAKMNAESAFGKDIVLRLGIGVNTGPMVVGNMGGEERFDYTVMGDAVNLGSRVEGLNKEYGTEIIVTETVVAKLPRDMVLRPLDLVAVKGKKEPVEIFEVVGKPGDVSAEKKEAAQKFTDARALYRARDFARAKDAFAAIVASNPTDVAAAQYVMRCETFLQSPPPDAWDGVWVMTKK